MNRRTGIVFTELAFLILVVSWIMLSAYDYATSILYNFVFCVNANSIGEGWPELVMLVWSVFYGLLFIIKSMDNAIKL